MAFPENSNEAVKNAEAKIGPYKYNIEDDPKDIELLWRGPIELDNGSIY